MPVDKCFFIQPPAAVDAWIYGCHYLLVFLHCYDKCLQAGVWPR